MPEISRRRFLINTATAGAAVAVVAPVVAAESEIHPLARLRALHGEASALMAVHNEEMGGEWELRIRAPHNRLPIIYRSLDTSPRERLDAAIAELKAAANAIWPAADDWMVKIDGTESVPLLITNYVRTRGSCGQDGSLLLADDVAGTTACADREGGAA
jgi:hypothetical protein